MTKLHTYTYVQERRTPRGTQVRLRRDDGLRVVVSRKRLNELHSKGQLKLGQDWRNKD